MAEADQLATPVEEWNKLHERSALTTELIREFWKESVPRLAVPPPAAPAEVLSEFDNRRQRLLLQPLSRFLLGDDAVDGEAAAAKSNVCGKVFNIGDPTYSCRDCEQDPTCVLCTECFSQSAHRYHRYLMCVSPGSGGFCDCGDPEAWKCDPTCATHQPPAEQRPLTVSAEQASKAALLFSAAMQYVLSVFDRDASTLKIVPLELDLGREHYPPRHQRYATVAYNFGVTATDKAADAIAQLTPCSPEEAKAATTALKEGMAILLYNDITGCDDLLKRLKPEQPRKLRRAELHVVHAHVAAHQLFAVRLVRQLRQMLEQQPQLRPIFNTVMQQTVGGSELMPSLLERLMACDGRQWKQARHESHLLLIQGMLMDIESKKYFAQMFTTRYREQTLASLPNRIQDQITIQDLSVQIYTVPSIAHHLIAEQDALAVVIGTMVDETRTHTHGGQLVLRDIDADPTSRRRFERLMSSCLLDAKYLLSVVPQTQTDKLRAGVRRGLDSLLELLYFCEGMEPAIRAQTAHVLYDTPYQLQLTLSFTLAPLVNQMLEWCSADRQLLVYAYSADLLKLHSRLPPDKYFHRSEVERFGRRLSVNLLSVMAMPVSLELPLSRLLAGLHLHLAAHGLSYNSSEFAGLEDRVTPAQMLERPLRALVMDAQVRAGLWKRNGRSLEIMCKWYSLSAQVANMRDRDLQVAQICASLMDPDEFVATLLFRHGAAGETSPEDDPKGERREHLDSNLADFLLLLLTVFAERYHEGVGVVTREQCLQNEVIQYLCVKPMTHSQLSKRLPDADSSLLETVVGDVADFVTQQDYRGQRTYHIKPEFLHRYTSMWHHYSRQDRSLSEQRLRRLCQQRGESACLPPPPTPPFQPALRPVRAVLTCDFTLQLLLQQLNRMFGTPFAASLELILRRVLFLIGTALNEEEREAATEEREPFCFSGPAQRAGIVDVLHKLVGNPHVSHHAELLAWVNTKLNRLLGRAAAAPDSSAAAAEDAGSEQKRRRAQAAARRARILGQMQAQQKKFVTQNVTVLAELREAESEQATSGGPARAVTGSTMDLSECAGADEWPVCLGPRQSARPAAAAEYTCILCQASEQVSSTRPAMVMAAFVQLSTVLSRDRSSSAANPVLYVPSSLHRLPHTSSCGHAMHAACWQRHFDSVVRDRRAHPRALYLSSFDVQRQEFLCPLCLRLSNTVIPLVPGGLEPGPSPAAGAPADHIGTWLSGLLVACGPVCGEEPEGDPCSGCDPDWPEALTKAVTSQMTARESSQFLAVCRLGTPPPVTHLSTREMAERFFHSAHTAAHLAPSATDDRRQVVLQTCVYSLHAAEQLLRATGRPLLVEDSSRAHICLRQVVRVCATMLPAPDGLQPARHQCLALLRRLLQPADGGPTVLEFDAFGVVVLLSHGLPTLTAGREAHGPLSPTGSLQELQCVRLSLLLHLVQVLLTLDVAELTRQQPMETDGQPAAADQDEQQWLAELYTLVRSAAGVEVADVSPPLLRRYVTGAVTPFLRCCALYFHFLTGVWAPSELLQPLPLAEQYPHLLRYLGLDSLCVPQATDCHSVLQELVVRWCRQPGLTARLAELPARLIVPSDVNRLIDLPHEYSDLILQASSFRCECDEQESPMGPALCLVCGALLCSGLGCGSRRPAGGRRGVDGHAVSCGAGVGVLLVVRRCKLYLLHTSGSSGGRSRGETARKTTYPSPYVDRFCEADPDLRRGNPLTLKKEHYNRLNQLWLAHGVCDNVTRSMEDDSVDMLLD